MKMRLKPLCFSRRPVAKAALSLTGFTLKEVLEATGARLISGSFDNYFQGVSIDSRTITCEDIFICIQGKHFDGHNFIPEAIDKGVKCIIVSKEVSFSGRLPKNILFVENAVSALSDLAYCHRKKFGIPVIGITGSGGKTTTKEMLSSLLGARYKVLKNEGTQNNAIGLSLTLLRLNREHDIAVLELGTSNFGEIKELMRLAACSVGIITNIGLAHLEFFGSEEAVLNEKWDLFRELSPPHIAILNADDERLRQKLGQVSSDEADAVFFTFGLENNADFIAKKVVSTGRNLSFWIKNFPIHLNTILPVNVYNALSAYAAARLFSVDGYDIIRKFKGFKFPPSRFQIKNINGLKVIDDAYNANPSSFGYAIETLSRLKAEGKKIAVIGDMLELGDRKELLHRKLGEALGRADIDLIVAVGALSHIAADAAVAAGFSPKAVYKCSSSGEAKKVVCHKASLSDVLLLKGSRAMKLEELFE